LASSFAVGNNLVPKKSKSLTPPCPICENSQIERFVSSRVAGCEICSDCDYFIDLGFSNYDEQPEQYLYPVSWVYDRLHTLTGRSYLQNKIIWLNEVVESLEVLIAPGTDARKDCQGRHLKTAEKALQETRQDIERVEQLLLDKRQGG
jgi:hypothetical protein